MSLIDNKTPRRLRALIYNRVSSDPTGKAVSVRSQDTENRATCEREGWEVVATVTDNDRSASSFATRERDGFAEVHRAMAAGEFDVLVCWESSRSNRDLGVYVALRDACARYGVLYRYKGKSFDMTTTNDRFITGVDALVDEREAWTLRDRVMRGIRRTILEGTPHGTTPYGYVRLRDERTGRPAGQVPHPETAPVVRELVARVLSGDTLYTIAADLNRRGEPTPQARKDGTDRVWGSATIRAVLRSQSMLGVRTHHGVPHAEPTWEPIVDARDWREVQQVLADPNRARNHRGVRVRYLLSGIATCGPCGAWLRPATNRGRFVYQCAGHGVGHALGKGHVSRPRELMDAMVVRRVVKRLSDPQLLVTIARQQQGADEHAAAVSRRLGEAEAKRDRARARAVAAQDPAVETENLLLAASVQQDIDALRAELARRSMLPQAVLELAGPDAAARWDALDGDVVRQRQVVRALLQITVHRSTQRRGVRSADAASVEIVEI